MRRDAPASATPTAAGTPAGDGTPNSDATMTDAHVVTPGAIGSPGAPLSSHGLRDDEILAGRYRVARFIAGGGMGEVYEAEDVLLREQVAVKLLRPELLRKPGAQDRFAEEIKIARRITHPNVCRVVDVRIAHLDLKPSNALLTGRDGSRLVITDFGLATSCCAELGCRCDMPHHLGTPMYMSPEQVEGKTPFV